MSGSVIEEARRLLAAGISVIPIVLGGDKRPPVAWEAYQSRLATEEEALKWWGGPRPYGIAAVCGAASGGLEAIDFDRDAEELYRQWCAEVETNIPGLLERLIVVRTPRQPSGMHVWFRCREAATPGNQKLAIDPSRPGKERTLIETRGEGGYALVPGGPDAVHENGKPYEYLAESLADVPDISAEDRDFLLAVAKGLTREAAKEERPPSGGPGQDLRPGDDFDRRGSWEDILRAAGWEKAGQKGNEIRWRRPGKDRCWSATTGVCKSGGSDLLRVFSSSCHPLEDGKAYGKFRFLALTEFGGDVGKCASELRRRGFGGPPASSRADKADRAPASEEEATKAGLKVATIADLKKAGAEVEWLWPGWLAKKVVCGMAAEGGMGKTRFCCDLARRIKFGLPWPDGTPMSLPRDSKIMWVVADQHHDQLVSVTEAWDVEDTVVLNSWANDPYEGTSLECEDDFTALGIRASIAKPVLIVVDTVGNATDRNLSRQEDARAFYLPLMLIARKRNCCVLALTHLNASGQILGRRAKEKMRVVINLAKPDPQDKKLALSVSKTFDKTPDALGVWLEDHGYEFDKEPPQAPEGLEPGMPAHVQQAIAKKGRGRPPAATGEAIEWLRVRLAGGLPVRVVDLRRDWEAQGIGTGAAYAARDAIAVEDGGEGRLTWRLRTQPNPDHKT